jgi:hypothetical protein
MNVELLVVSDCPHEMAAHERDAASPDERRLA